MITPNQNTEHADYDEYAKTRRHIYPVSQSVSDTIAELLGVPLNSLVFPGDVAAEAGAYLFERNVVRQFRNSTYQIVAYDLLFVGVDVPKIFFVLKERVNVLDKPFKIVGIGYDLNRNRYKQITQLKVSAACEFTIFVNANVGEEV